MKVAVPINDGLWRCLCPAYSSGLPIPVRRASRSTPSIWRHSLHQSRARYSTTSAHDTVTYPDTESIFPRMPAQHLTRYPQNVCAVQENKNKNALRNESTAKLHKKLLGFARDGNYEKVGRLTEILIRDRGEKPAAEHYRAMILANTDTVNGSSAEVERLLEEMESDGIPFDSWICNAVLKALAIHPDYVLRAKFLQKLSSRFTTLTKLDWHYVIAGLLRDREPELALESVAKMQELNHKPASWLTNLFIFHYLSTSEFMAAHAIIARDSASLKTSVLSYALATAAESMYHPLVSYIWRSHVSNSGKSLQTLNPSNGVCIAILDTAARYADVGLATDVMRVLGGRSTALFAHHYEALIDMYLAADELKAAFTTFGIMAKSSHPVTDGTTRSLLLWLSNDPTRPELALALIRSQAEALGQVKGMGTNVIPVAVMNAIMEAQLAEPSLSTPVAMETFHSLSTFSPPIKPTLQTFNSILRGIGLSRRKNSKASAMYIVTQMLESQITPDMLTYDRLILVCVASEEERLGEEEKLYEMGEDNLGDAYRYLEEMKEQNWWPRGGTAAKLVRLSVIAGDDRAWALLHDMRTVGIDLSKVENWAYSYAANRRVTQESD